MRLDRRRFLKVMGLGGATLALPGAASTLLRAGRARAQATAAPTRVIFFVTPHGTVWDAWNMTVPGLAAGASGTASIASLPDASFSQILQPLAPHKQKLTIVEGLSRPSAIEYERAHDSEGDSYDLNRHDFGRANLMTCVDPHQRPGTICLGGGVSIDQVIGAATTGAGRWASRVYGFSGGPYSYVASGEATARVEDPRQAFDDVVGLYTPPAPGDTRAAAIQRARGSVLDFVAQEHARIAPRLGADDRAKLERHAQLVRDLEASFAAPTGPARAACDPSWSATGHVMDQFARVTTLALACDLTRVVTFVAPDLDPTEIGLPATVDMHQDYAHQSIREDAPAFTTEAERGMILYNAFYAQHFAYLLDQLDSIPEGDGTLLDHTAVVWTSELATGTHDLHDIPIVIAGGAGGALRTGQYVRYARDVRLEAGWGFYVNVGPAQNRLYVSLMHAMGMTDTSFGVASVPRADGGTLSLTGTLPEIMAG